MRHVIAIGDFRFATGDTLSGLRHHVAIGGLRRAVAIGVCGFSLVGCTSSWLPSADFLKPAPVTETLRFESEPSNAEARISPTQACRTPCELQVTPSGDITATFTLQGYETQAQIVKLVPPDDPNSGSTEFRLYPNPVYAELEAAPTPARPARTTRPPAKKAAPAPKRAAAPAAPKSAAPRSAAPAAAPATPAPPANSPFPPAPASQFPPPPPPPAR